MGLNAQQNKELCKRVNALVQAEIEYSWKGAQTPEGAEECDVALKKARQRYNDYLFSLRETPYPNNRRRK